MKYYQIPTEVVRGENCVIRQADFFENLGDKALILTGKNGAVRSGALADVVSALCNKGIGFAICDRVRENPTVSLARDVAAYARQKRADFIIAIGGGSAIDAAKGAAVLVHNKISDDALFALSWDKPALPLCFVGTTAGTGSEVTSIAVLTDDATGRKRSINRTDLYGRVAFCDYQYTLTMDYETTVSTALDALCHAVEGYFSVDGDRDTDEYTFEAVQRLFAELKRLRSNANIYQTDSFRRKVYDASIQAGVTLNSCKTGFGHLAGYLLTEQCGIPHGFACAVFLPAYLELGKKAFPVRAEALSQSTHAEPGELASIADYFCRQYFTTHPFVLTAGQVAGEEQRYEQAANRTRSPGGLDANQLVSLVAGQINKYSE